jgi:hypothetical protein
MGSLAVDTSGNELGLTMFIEKDTCEHLKPSFILNNLQRDLSCGSQGENLILNVEAEGSCEERQ